MEKRDLKADLELCNKATPGPWEFGPIYAGTIAGELDEERHRANRELLNNFREGWPHAIERALKAEALARELVEALKHIERLAEQVRRRTRNPGAVMMPILLMSYGAEMRIVVEGALEKAREVLGDE